MNSNKIKQKLLRAVKRRQKNIDTNINIQKNFLKKNKKLNEIYKEDVAGYTDEMNYKEINRYMYGKYVEFYTENYVIPNINGMFKIFKDIPKLTTDITAFRVTDYKINRKTLTNNKELFIPAFTSTTYKLDFENNAKNIKNIIDIIIPKGSKGIIAADSKYYEDEREIILPPGYYELMNETTKELRSGVKTNFYKIKLKKQILTVEYWLEHLELNNKEIEEQEYFEDKIQKLNEPIKSLTKKMKKVSIKTPVKKTPVKKTPVKKTPVVLKKKIIKIRKRPIKIKKRPIKMKKRPIK